MKVEIVLHALPTHLRLPLVAKVRIVCKIHIHIFKISSHCRIDRLIINQSSSSATATPPECPPQESDSSSVKALLCRTLPKLPPADRECDGVGPDVLSSQEEMPTQILFEMTSTNHNLNCSLQMWHDLRKNTGVPMV